MIELGNIQALTVVRITSNGAYLESKDVMSGDMVFLPKKEMPQGLKTGDSFNVFIDNDSNGNCIATVRIPKLTLGEVAKLVVVETTDIGAFLDWGLARDLFLPFKEQLGSIQKGDEILVLLYVDKTGRLCASMKIYEHLSSHSPYRKDEKVRGIVYSINPKIGYFIAVDGRYHGLILNKEMYGFVAIGDTIQTRIKRVRPDGKSELSMRDAAYVQIEKDARTILDRLKRHGGKLSLNDSSSPNEIKAELNMSKKAFKRAVGRLLKEGAILITENGIEISWK